MPVKIQKKQKVATQSKSESTELQDTTKTASPTQQTTQTWSSVDLSNFLATMTQMMSQQWEMMKMMDERMKKLEEQNANTAVKGEVVEETPVINEDNTATYNREAEEWYAEIINKVWKIMYITEQAPIMKWDAAPMMATVEERRKVWNMIVSDTKYFNSEADAKAYIENLRQKGITLPGARIISCYI